MRKLVIDNDELFGRVVELLQEGREVTIPSKGFSMLPFIRGERDLVVLERADEIKPGDIVLFRLDGRYILHRVMDADAALGRWESSGTENGAWIRMAAGSGSGWVPGGACSRYAVGCSRFIAGCPGTVG